MMIQESGDHFDSCTPGLLIIMSNDYHCWRLGGNQMVGPLGVFVPSFQPISP